MPFKDFLEGYQFNADDFDFEKFKADALGEHTKDEGVWTAKVDSVSQINAKMAEDLKQQKVDNYDLLKRIPADPNSNPVTNQQQEQQETETTIDSLFGKPTKEE